MSAVTLGRAAAGVQPKDDNFAGLTKYVPTEAVTLYVATVSATPELKSFLPWMSATVSYYLWLAFTPIIVLLVYLGARPADPTVSWYKKWPWWKMVASAAAFAVWALAVPGNPYVSNTAAAAAAGVLALVVSTLLNLIGRAIHQS